MGEASVVPAGSRPDAAETVLGFVNTHADAGGRAEQLGSGADVLAWAVGHGLLPADAMVSDADAAAARELRDALVCVLLSHSDPGAGAVSGAERYLRQAGSRYPLTPVITAAGAALIAEAPGVPGMFGTVLAAVTELAQQGQWTWLKACANPPCHFGFLDRTRSHTGRFCSPGCRSAYSMREHRRRQRQLAD